jgi:hypothetical protein
MVTNSLSNFRGNNFSTTTRHLPPVGAETIIVELTDDMKSTM